ncbi:hypothetical protein HMPREF3222_01127 [Clostridium perfringens]|uniref:Uncharacterized protein n=1 Tax=Clostridium perfringens TaxID=1502 RepID=A0A133N999_CLOPF|nr:hypothetical protein HMPREF3222_01127 [Clostridium perfringens]
MLLSERRRNTSFFFYIFIYFKGIIFICTLIINKFETNIVKYMV